MGHAGADVPATNLSRDEVEADEANDPRPHFARLLDTGGALESGAALELYRETVAEVAHVAEDVGPALAFKRRPRSSPR